MKYSTLLNYSARGAAIYSIYCSIYREKSNSEIQASLDSNIYKFSLSEKDKSLCTELAYGYLRNVERINFILDNYFSSPKSVTSYARLIFGLAVYEILFLDSIPIRATLHSYVDIVKQTISLSFSKVANAVLRKIADNMHIFDFEYFKSKIPSLPNLFSVYYSTPLWIVNLYLSSFSKDNIDSILHANIIKPYLAFRLNSTHSEIEKFKNSFNEFNYFKNNFAFALNNPVYLKKFQPIILSALQSGLLSNQSGAFLSIVHELGILELQGSIWDACCGRGGKSLILLENGINNLYCSDPNFKRLKGFRREALRLGIDMPNIFQARADENFCLNFKPNNIIIDAPCSGLGVLSRRPDTKYKRTPQDIVKLTALQRKIISNCFANLAPGGKLFYITCTLNAAENEDQIKILLDKNPNARLEKQLYSDFSNPFHEFFFAAVLSKTKP